MPQQVVKSRFLKLNSSHIEYVLDVMNKNPSDIRNIRAYLLTALYERLSQEDKLDGESNSIANQKKILERYCKDHGITAYRHYDEDDGYSGTNFNRPGFQRMLADIKAGRIKRVIVKDYCAIIGLNQKDLENQGILA